MSLRQAFNPLSSRFFTTTVHELRTPIQSIIGTTELLQQTELDKEQAEYLRQLRFSSDVLLNLVNDILDLSKLISGQVKTEHIFFSLSDLCEQVVDLVCIEAHNKKIEIITDIDYRLPPSIKGDPHRTQQILLNLLKNAVKFTKEGYVHLSVFLDTSKTNIIFEVSDSGIGIPKEKQENLFEDFYQVDNSTTRKFGGTGLGLSISKGLTKLLGGKIGMKDNPSGGSLFWFSLPCIFQNATKPIKPAIPLDPQTRILLVDDNVLSLESFTKKLQFLGFEKIHVATSGQTALDMLKEAAEKKKPYKIAFIDMIMPVMDGWRLSAEINSDENINTTMLFLMVPEGQMGGEAKMKMLDWFNGYLYKPLKKKMLIETLKSISSDSSLDLEPIEIEKPKATGEKILFKQVLIAEDHPINQKLLKTFLEKLQIEVFTASNGKEAILCLNKNRGISFIFMDIQMPLMSGVEATRFLRKKKYKGIIVACTANTNEEDFTTYKQVGMNDYLLKPFKQNDVAKLLEKWSSCFIPTEKYPRQISKTKKILQTSWDSADLLDTVAGDVFLGKQLITQYIQQTRSALINARESLFQKNFERLASIAHALKGSSNAIAAHALALQAEDLEEYINTMLSEKIQTSEKKHDINTEVITSGLNNFSALFLQFEKQSQEVIDSWL